MKRYTVEMSIRTEYTPAQIVTILDYWHEPDSIEVVEVQPTYEITLEHEDGQWTASLFEMTHDGDFSDVLSVGFGSTKKEAISNLTF